MNFSNFLPSLFLLLSLTSFLFSDDSFPMFEDPDHQTCPQESSVPFPCTWDGILELIDDIETATPLDYSEKQVASFLCSLAFSGALRRSIEEDFLLCRDVSYLLDENETSGSLFGLPNLWTRTICRADNQYFLKKYKTEFLIGAAIWFADITITAACDLSPLDTESDDETEDDEEDDDEFQDDSSLDEMDDLSDTDFQILERNFFQLKQLFENRVSAHKQYLIENQLLPTSPQEEKAFEEIARQLGDSLSQDMIERINQIPQ